jgi:hypothetical protein
MSETFTVEIRLVQKADGIWVHWVDHGLHEFTRHGPHPTLESAQEAMRIIVDGYREEPGATVTVTRVGFK